MRRVIVGSVALGLLIILLAAVPASATGGGKWWPALRVHAFANDDGRAGSVDPGDIGDITASYDRWGRRSSDDPHEPGMDAGRLDGDVARCKAKRIDAATMRMRIQNAYPGYTCTFMIAAVSRIGGKLVVDDIRIEADPTLELTTLDGPEIGDELKRRRKLYGTYAVTVLQEAPQGETLEFDIELDFTYLGWRGNPPKCCWFCPRWR